MKGQTAIEFMSMVGLSMIILATLYGFMAQKQSEAYRYQNTVEARAIADDIGYNAEMALAQGEGYGRTISIPPRIGGQTYNVTMRNGTVYIGWGDQFVTESTLYQGRPIEVKSTDRTFMVKNNGSVYITPQ
jgi:hypothetical protein